MPILFARKANAILLVVLLLNHISSFSQAKDTSVIRAWGVEQRLRGGAPPPLHQPSIDRTTHRFFLETKPGIKIKVTAVWIGETAFAVVEEQQTNNATTGLTKTNNTVLQLLATDTLKACATQPSQLLGNEAVIVYQQNGKGKTYYAPIKTLEHTNINLP